MRTVVLGPRPAVLEELIERRRAAGADTYDEVWDGEYHMAPAPRFAHSDMDQQMAVLLAPLASNAGLRVSGAFNLGHDKENFRVPDRGLHRAFVDAVWLPTAALVVEIVSPDDESWDKLPFYAAHDVDEVLIVDPAGRSVAWLGRAGDGYEPITRSTLLEIDVIDFTAQIDWPPVGTDGGD